MEARILCLELAQAIQNEGKGIKNTFLNFLPRFDFRWLEDLKMWYTR